MLAKRLPITLIGVLTIVTARASAGDCALEALLFGTDIDLSTENTTQRRTPAAAYSSTDNEYLIVWFDTRNPGNNDIFAQRLSAAGTLLGTNIPVMEFPDAQIDPDVVYNGADNQYLASWRTQQAGFFNDARGRRLAADGTLVGSDFFIGTGGFEISMAYNSTDNQFLSSGRASGIRGQRITNAGTLIGGDFIIASAGAPAPNGEIAYNPTANEYFATWRNRSDQNLQGQRISASGTLLGSAVLISPIFPASGRAASVAFDPVADQYLIIFGEFQDNEIMGQLVSSSGTLIGGNFPIATGLVSSPSPSLRYSAASQAYLGAWRNGFTIVAQLLNSDGTPTGDPLSIAPGTATGRPRIAYNDTSGEFIIVWSDNRNLGKGQEDIFAQRIVVLEKEEVFGDLDGDCVVGATDLLILLVNWGSCDNCDGCLADLNGDCTVGASDLLALLANWG